MTTGFLCACDVTEEDCSLPVALCLAASPSSHDSRWTHTLFDGTPVTIRSTRHERAVAMELPAESRCYRFLGSIDNPAENRSEPSAGIDQPIRIAFNALVLRDGIEQLVGVACYRANADDSSCECSVAVADEWQGKGVGTLLLQHLIDAARMRGVHAMTSLDASDNRQMHDLVTSLGFLCEVDPDDAARVIHTLVLQDAPSPDSIKES